MITGKTRYYAILGDPIEQALSPVVHNAAFEALGMDAVMLGCRVTPEELKKAVEGTRALHFEGLAVTMPHKTAIIPLLDECDEASRVFNCVNHVKLVDGKLIGIAAPQRRVYAKWGQMQFAEAAVIPSLGNEFYATLMAVDQQNRAVFRLSSNPLVNWLWIGGILMCLLPFVSFRRRNGREN